MPVTNYVWDSLNDSYLMEFHSSDSSVTVYSQEASNYGRVISKSGVDGAEFYHCDRSGSTRLLTDGSQAIVGQYEFDSWGTLLFHLGLTHIGLLWCGATGYYYDWELNTYYVRLRTFHSSIARWSSLDSLPFNGHVNSYLSFMNNPLEFKDPGGAAIEEITNRIESGDWSFRLIAGPSFLTDRKRTHGFKVFQAISRNRIPKDSKQVWQVSVARGYVQTGSPGCSIEYFGRSTADVFDLVDVLNDPFSLDIQDFQGVVNARPWPGTPGPITTDGLFYPETLCQYYHEMIVIIGFDDGKGRLKPGNSRPVQNAEEGRRLVNSKNQGRYSYEYKFQNNCGTCLQCGVTCDCRAHEIITTPWVKATDENRPPLATVPSI